MLLLNFFLFFFFFYRLGIWGFCTRLSISQKKERKYVYKGTGNFGFIIQTENTKEYKREYCETSNRQIFISNSKRKKRIKKANKRKHLQLLLLLLLECQRVLFSWKTQTITKSFQLIYVVFWNGMNWRGEEYKFAYAK